jgi:hypothetical protein
VQERLSAAENAKTAIQQRLQAQPKASDLSPVIEQQRTFAGEQIRILQGLLGKLEEQQGQFDALAAQMEELLAQMEALSDQVDELMELVGAE